MIEPFADHPWRIEYYEMDRDLWSKFDCVSVTPGVGESTAILAAEYFGRKLPTASRDALTRLQHEGVCVIEDRTHNLFDWDGFSFDYAIASLRKLLPLGDGAVLLGGEWDLPSSDGGPGELFWAAMERKARATNSAGMSETRALFAAAEVRFAEELSPAAASARTVDAIPRLDYLRMAARRISNARTLKDRMGGFDIVNFDEADSVPSHLVVRVSDPEFVQDRLASEGIYCPIHWPRPSAFPLERPWAGDIISIPVDHRYDDDDMTYVANALTDIVQQ